MDVRPYAADRHMVPMREMMPQMHENMTNIFSQPLMVSSSGARAAPGSPPSSREPRRTNMYVIGMEMRM